MKRTLPNGFEVDDDPARIDLDVVFGFLSTESYWAKGRSRQTVERLIAEASRVIGIYDGDRQIAFARTLTDGVSFGWLADVFVLGSHRGKGVGVELVREAIENSPVKPRRWILGTADAHGLYAKFGFGPPDDRMMVLHVPNATEPSPGVTPGV